jgi:protein-S-isoprenylcysteine O-methyltransferase Ste14
MENTTRLVTSGLYGVLRHPMYASLLYLGTGIWLKGVDLVTTCLAVLNAVALFFTARLEEGEMLAKFGGEYRAYMGRTKRFIPFVF